MAVPRAGIGCGLCATSSKGGSAVGVVSGVAVGGGSRSGKRGFFSSRGVLGFGGWPSVEEGPFLERSLVRVDLRSRTQERSVVCSTTDLEDWGALLTYAIVLSFVG